MAERLAYTQHTAVRFRLGGWARSSLAEHRHDKPRAGSSILPAPTISRALRFWRGARSFKPVRLGSIPARATNPCASGTMDRAPDYKIRRVRVQLLPGAPFRGPIAQWTEQPASTRRIGVRVLVGSPAQRSRGPMDQGAALRRRSIPVRLRAGAPIWAATQTAKRRGPNPRTSGCNSLAAYQNRGCIRKGIRSGLLSRPM